MGRGPFGQAIRIRKEEDKTFRPFLFVPRARLHDSPIEENVQQAIPVIYNAWLQGHLHRQPGLQPGEAPDFPKDQFSIGR